MIVKNINKAIEDSLYSSLRSILDFYGYGGVVVIFANQGGLEPEHTYCLINILDKKRMGGVDESQLSPVEGEEAELTYTNHYILCTQISFIGRDSGEVIGVFEDSVFSSRNCLEMLQRNNLGAIRQSKSRRNPQKRETTWVDCYNIDLDLSFAIQSKEEIDWIDSFTTTWLGK